MSGIYKDQVQRLRTRIREFEDRKISGADLCREIYFVARELSDNEEVQLRRALEGLGNKVAVLVEQGRVMQVHPEILNVVDEIQGELVIHGY